MSRGGKTREGKRQGARNPNHKPLSQLISCTSNSLSKQKAGKYKKVIFWFETILFGSYLWSKDASFSTFGSLAPWTKIKMFCFVCLSVLSLTNLWPCEWNEEESCQKGQQISRCLIKTCKRLLGTNWQLMLLVWRHFCLLQYKNLRSVLKRLNL